MQDHTSIKSLKIKTFKSGEVQKKDIPIDVERINKILGTQIDRNEYLSYLDKLGFTINAEIKIPHHRHDISSQNDLAEEVARVIGYNNINPQSFLIKKDVQNDDKKIQKIRHALVRKGFFEVINFPFSSEKRSKSIEVDNPLDTNRGYLRTELKDSLLENLLYNERRQKDSIKLFEISDIYSKEDHINQEKKIGIIISGRRGNNYIDFTKKLDASFLEDILKNDSTNNSSAIVEIPRSQLKTKKKDKIFYTEISIHEINENLYKNIELNEIKKDFIKFKPVSEFPLSIRDFSFSIKDNLDYIEAINYISDLNDINLKDSYIFDFYKNKELNEVKVGLRLIFQSHNKTLSEEDIQKSIDNILQPIIDLKSVDIPGYN